MLSTLVILVPKNVHRSPRWELKVSISMTGRLCSSMPKPSSMISTRRCRWGSYVRQVGSAAAFRTGSLYLCYHMICMLEPSRLLPKRRCSWGYTILMRNIMTVCTSISNPSSFCISGLSGNVIYTVGRVGVGSCVENWKPPFHNMLKPSILTRIENVDRCRCSWRTW